MATRRTSAATAEQRKEFVSNADQRGQELQSAFSFYDRDNDGFITRADIRVGITEMWCEPSEAALDEIMAKVNLENTGKISCNEFMAVQSYCMLLGKKMVLPIPSRDMPRSRAVSRAGASRPGTADTSLDKDAGVMDSLNPTTAPSKYLARAIARSSLGTQALGSRNASRRSSMVSMVDSIPENTEVQKPCQLGVSRDSPDLAIIKARVEAYRKAEASGEADHEDSGSRSGSVESVATVVAGGPHEPGSPIPTDTNSQPGFSLPASARTSMLSISIDAPPRSPRSKKKRKKKKGKKGKTAKSSLKMPNKKPKKTSKKKKKLSKKSKRNASRK